MNMKKNDAQLREQPEPDEVPNPLPWHVVMALGAMFMWGSFYIYDASLNQEAVDGADLRYAPAVANTEQVAEAANQIDGKQVYTAKCVACHQANGQGVPGVFPPLAGSEWVLESPERLASIPLRGIAGELTVKGVKYNGMMPAFASQLDDAELAAVLTYIRSDWGNQADAITAETVAKVRERFKDKAMPWQGDAELSQFE